MYRDFSEKSKITLLKLVSEVENERLSNFTDWVSDRWHDFESWIGKLNIKNYINNINVYHKKVIDKNNTTKQSIEKIFNNVASIDNSYKTIFSDTKGSLQQWLTYIDQMSRIVNPSNGKFHSQYMKSSLNSIVNNILKQNIDTIKKYLAGELSGDINYVARILREFLSMSPSDMTNEEKNLLVEIQKNGKMLVKSFFTGLSNSNVALSTGNEKSIAKSILQLWMGKYTFHDATEDIEPESAIKYISNISKAVGKYGKKDRFTLASSALSYFSTLCGVATSENKSTGDVISNFLSLFKGSAGLEVGIFNYYEKTLKPTEAFKLDLKFGNTMTGLSILSSLAGGIDEGIDIYEVFSDPNSTVYDRAAQGIKSGGSLVDLVGNIYIATQANNKVLQVVATPKGMGILGTNQTLKYAQTSTAASKISKISTFLAITNVSASTISSGIKKYGEVTSDGTFDIKDAGTVGIFSSLSGLDTVVNSLSLGLLDFDSEALGTDLMSEADAFLMEDNWISNHLRDPNSPEFFRMSLSLASSPMVLQRTVEKNVINCVVTKVNTVSSWVDAGWNSVKKSESAQKTLVTGAGGALLGTLVGI